MVSVARTRRSRPWNCQPSDARKYMLCFKWWAVLHCELSSYCLCFAAPCVMNHAWMAGTVRQTRCPSVCPPKIRASCAKQGKVQDKSEFSPKNPMEKTWANCFIDHRPDVYHIRGSVVFLFFSGPHFEWCPLSASGRCENRAVVDGKQIGIGERSRSSALQPPTKIATAAIK